MRAGLIVPVLTALLATVASGQTPVDTNIDRVLSFTNPRTPVEVQEIVNVIRAVAGIPQAVPDSPKGTVAVRGTVDQIGLAQWLFTELDRPQGPGSGTLEYRLRGSDPDVARIFYATYAETPQSLQEMVNLIRAVTDIQRVMPYNPQKAVVLRGGVGQVGLAEWLIHEVDQPQTAGSSTNEYRLPGNTNEVARVFRLASLKSPLELQQAINVIRATTKIQRIMPYTAPMMVAMRGTDSQIADAERLIREFDRPSSTKGPR